MLVPAALAAACVSPGPAAWAAESVTVFAAASLSDAMEAVGQAYRSSTGGEVRFAFAASSTLARQIAAGAPAHLFISANEAWMDALERDDLIDPASRVSPIRNSLVLIAPVDGAAPPAAIDRGLDLAARLGADGRLAMGDPAHVPAGIYARQALETLGLWHSLEPRLAYADNVRVALALVERGEAPLGIVYATDAAISRGVRVVGLFPAGSHAPITYPFALIKAQANEDARAFFRYLTSDAAREIFARYGFKAESNP